LAKVKKTSVALRSLEWGVMISLGLTLPWNSWLQTCLRPPCWCGDWASGVVEPRVSEQPRGIHAIDQRLH
jgi:hypothetical protein